MRKLSTEAMLALLNMELKQLGTSIGAKIWKILPNDYKELISLSTFKSKIKIGKQINAFEDYAKPISSELALFDWPFLRQINVF